jgi:2-polyprenyl-6-methoxyphenol hydroxylase-like FAD-dependent oxidoreductase
VRGTEPDGPFEIRADLVVGCDGRHSTVRAAAGLAGRGRRRADRRALVPDLAATVGNRRQSLARTGRHIVVTIDRGDYWQCAFVIPKGGADALPPQAIDVLRGRCPKGPRRRCASRIADLRPGTTSSC